MEVYKLYVWGLCDECVFCVWNENYEGAPVNLLAGLVLKNIQDQTVDTAVE